MMPNPGRIRP